MANNDPKCRLMSISKELDLNSYKLETKIKCAEELIGKNSEIPCMADNIKTSMTFCNITSN